MNKNQLENKKEIQDYIINVVREKNPKTVEELIDLVKTNYFFSPRKDILKHILHLEEQGKIVLKETYSAISPLFKNYLFSKETSWFWAIIAISVATAALVLTVPENAYPLIYVRHALGLIMVLFLPGYTLINALFPEKEIDSIESIALSVGLSLALVPTIGLILSYTPLGIRTTPITLSLLALTAAFASIALIREHQNKITSTKT